jgi:hypothetical protein
MSETAKPVKDGESKAIPPYAPYKTLSNFIDSLKVTIPSRIDRSVMGSMSGAMQSQLTSTLRYLGLTSAAGLPSDMLTQLVHSEGPERKKRMHALLVQAYPFLFNDQFDIARASQKEFEEAFDAVVPSAETAKKCMSFFLAAAKDAGVTLSPHIKKRSGPRAPRSRRPLQAANGVAETPAHKSEVQGMTWEQMLLSKFPSFDPAWPDEVKAKWFTAFDQLMRQGQQKGGFQ